MKNITKKKVKERSKIRNFFTAICFIIFVIIAIIWFYSVRNDYYEKIQQTYPPTTESKDNSNQ